MTQEDREEWRQDMLEESRRDELHDKYLREDYDNFTDFHSEEIKEISELYDLLKKAHEEYGYDFELKDILL